jgi:phosphoglucosamine mutase
VHQVIPSKKLFGTDGVRGVVGSEVTAELAMALGRAAALTIGPRRPQALVVRDTRESGPMLASALAAGLADGGADVWMAGVLPTPAASILVWRHGLDFAAVVSASHNPWTDNGIKLFSGDGRKLPAEAEAEIENAVTAAGSGNRPVGRIRDLEGALDDYLRELHSVFQLDLGGRRVALDCANGATHRAAPAIFERLGAEVISLGTEPDGRNINLGCGATEPAAVARRVVEADAEIGFAFDGDGDRVIAADRRGGLHDGDELLGLAGLALHQGGALGGGIVVTVMTNLGFHRAMRAAGIEVATTPVGDRHVAAALDERGWTLGGEQSGHLIWTEAGRTGDGIAAALLAMRSLGRRDLADAVPFEKLPQALVNVRVTDRAGFERSAAIREAVAEEEAGLDGRGRVLLRPSGTEPVVRVMVEAETRAECEAVAERLSKVVAEALG